MPPPSSALRSQTQRRNVATQAPKSRSPKTLSTVDSKYVLAGIVHAHELRERPAPGFRAKPTRGHDRKQPLQRKPPKPRVTTILVPVWQHILEEDSANYDHSNLPGILERVLNS